MGPLRDDAARKLPLLRQRLTQAIELAKECTASTTIPESDDFGFMTLNFLNKQLDHAESLLLLIPRRDTSLIARTMFEGLIQLLWAYQDAKDRGRQWRAFALVHDWRLSRAEAAAGREVDEIHRRRIENGLAEFGQIFLKRKSSRRDDPYHDSWRAGTQLKDMASAIGGADQYDELYVSMSDWAHWGPGGFGDAISRSESFIEFSSESTRVCVQSLILAFQSLLQTTAIADAHLRLSRKARIDSLLNSCLDDLQAE